MAGRITTGACELGYQSIGPGTQLDTFTTEDSLIKTLAPPYIPPNYFSNPSDQSRKIRVVAKGRAGTTGTPTMIWTLRLLTSTTFAAGGGIGFSTAAITLGNGITLGPWELDVEIVMRTLGVGAASTIEVMGFLKGGTILAAGGGIYSLPAANVAFTSSSFDASVTNYIFLSATCGTSSGSNLIKCESLSVYYDN